MTVFVRTVDTAHLAGYGCLVAILAKTEGLKFTSVFGGAFSGACFAFLSR